MTRSRRTPAQRYLIGTAEELWHNSSVALAVAPVLLAVPLWGQAVTISRPGGTALPRFATPQHRPERRPRATRQRRHEQQPSSTAATPPLTTVTTASGPPAIRRGSFLEHARQFPEVSHAPVARVTGAAARGAAIHQPPRPLRTPRAVLATALYFLTARRTA